MSTFDVKLQRNGGNGGRSRSVTIPQPLADALAERGYNRVRIEVIADGILLKPYVGVVAPREAVSLPAWGSDD